MDDADDIPEDIPDPQDTRTPEQRESDREFCDRMQREDATRPLTPEESRAQEQAAERLRQQLEAEEAAEPEVGWDPEAEYEALLRAWARDMGIKVRAGTAWRDEVLAGIEAVRRTRIEPFVEAQRAAAEPGEPRMLRSFEDRIGPAGEDTVGYGLSYELDEGVLPYDDMHETLEAQFRGYDEGFTSAGHGWILMTPGGQIVTMRVRLELWSGRPPQQPLPKGAETREIRYTAWSPNVRLNDGFDGYSDKVFSLGRPGRYHVRVVARGRATSHDTEREDWTLQLWPDLR